MSDAEKRIEKKEKLARKLALRGGPSPPAPAPPPPALRGLGKGVAQPGPLLGSGPPNRDGRPRLPVGQHEVKNWPVLDLGFHPEIATSEWTLEVGGLVARPLVLDWKAFMALPQVEDVSDFHCVTTWSRFDNRWKGVRLATIAEKAGVSPEARFVHFEAYDDYTTNLSLEKALEPDVLLVHEWEGKPLPREHGGPVRVITPKLYAWKGAKWIRKVTFLAEDMLGLWEVRGYSNTAEPWANDRYS